MKPQHSDIDPRRLESVEQLLRGAAEFEPAAAAPADLLYRALEKLESGPEVRRPAPTRRLAVYFAMLSGAGAAGAAMAGLLWGASVRPLAAGPQPQIASMAPIKPQPEPPAQPEPPEKPILPPDDPPMTQLVRHPRPSGASLARWTPRRRSVPKARLVTEAVYQELATSREPAWLVEHDPETNTLVASPGVLDLVVNAGERTSPMPKDGHLPVETVEPIPTQFEENP
jgi:hypothetical protein